MLLQIRQTSEKGPTGENNTLYDVALYKRNNHVSQTCLRAITESQEYANAHTREDRKDTWQDRAEHMDHAGARA